MSARVIETAIPRTVSIRDMHPGQIGTFRYGIRTILALRTYDGIVDLNCPGSTWDSSRLSHQIELLPEGSRVEIVAQDFGPEEH